MRDIKFKAFSKITQIVTKKAYDLLEIDEIFEEDGFKHPPNPSHSKSDIIFMQYTGYNDANGKEIYEYDVIGCGRVNYIVLWGYLGWICIPYPELDKDKIYYKELWKLTDYYTSTNKVVTKGTAIEYLKEKFCNQGGQNG